MSFPIALTSRPRIEQVPLKAPNAPPPEVRCTLNVPITLPFSSFLSKILKATSSAKAVLSLVEDEEEDEDEEETEEVDGDEEGEESQDSTEEDDEDDGSISLLAMETELKPQILETLDTFSKISKKMRALQEKRMNKKDIFENISIVLKPSEYEDLNNLVSNLVRWLKRRGKEVSVLEKERSRLEKVVQSSTFKQLLFKNEKEIYKSSSNALDLYFININIFS